MLKKTKNGRYMLPVTRLDGQDGTYTLGLDKNNPNVAFMGGPPFVNLTRDELIALATGMVEVAEQLGGENEQQ